MHTSLTAFRIEQHWDTSVSEYFISLPNACDEPQSACYHNLASQLQCQNSEHREQQALRGLQMVKKKLKIWTPQKKKFRPHGKRSKNQCALYVHIDHHFCYFPPKITALMINISHVRCGDCASAVHFVTNSLWVETPFPIHMQIYENQNARLHQFQVSLYLVQLRFITSVSVCVVIKIQNRRKSQPIRGDEHCTSADMISRQEDFMMSWFTYTSCNDSSLSQTLLDQETQWLRWRDPQEPCITSTHMAQNKVSYMEHSFSFLKFSANNRITDWNGTSSQCLIKSGILYSVPCCRGNHQILMYPGSPKLQYKNMPITVHPGTPWATRQCLMLSKHMNKMWIRWQVIMKTNQYAKTESRLILSNWRSVEVNGMSVWLAHGQVTASTCQCETLHT
jgi:hypothetical protein